MSNELGWLQYLSKHAARGYQRAGFYPQWLGRYDRADVGASWRFSDSRTTRPRTMIVVGFGFGGLFAAGVVLKLVLKEKSVRSD